MIKAICPGSFDPITNGHLDIIKRAATMFDEVIVVVMTNYNKKGQYAFSEEERVELIKASTAHLPNVKVDIYNGLLANYTKENDINVVVKGLRALSDFDSEFQQALANKKMDPKLETVFITTSAEYMYLSSSFVKQLGDLGADISEFVPAPIHDFVSKRLRKD